MKKSIICLALATMLALSLQSTAFASNSSNVGALDGGVSTESTQIMFAQLEIAEAYQKQVADTTTQVGQLQQEQREAANHLIIAQNLQALAKSRDTATEMPADIASYMQANNLAYDTTGNDLLMTADEWNTAVSSLQAHLEALGQNTQQMMVYLQDFIGQYNSHLQDTDAQTQSPNQTLSSLARGQSMYGDSDVGLAATTLVIGLALGCVATLGVQRLRGRKDAA